MITKCPPAYDPSLEYDSYQFEEEPSHRDILRAVDFTDAGRMQIFCPQKIQKTIPSWVLDEKKFKKVVYDHPQAKRLADKWIRILNLYYKMRWTAEDIAEELNMHVDAVEDVIRRLNRRAEKSRGSTEL